jgi:hypothetical protein
VLASPEAPLAPLRVNASKDFSCCASRLCVLFGQESPNTEVTETLRPAPCGAGLRFLCNTIWENVCVSRKFSASGQHMS